MSLTDTTIYTIGHLREVLAQFSHLPDETPLVIAKDDGNENDSYTWICKADVALWDESIRYELPENNPDGKYGTAPDDAEKALFMWGAS